LCIEDDDEDDDDQDFQERVKRLRESRQADVAKKGYRNDDDEEDDNEDDEDEDDDEDEEDDEEEADKDGYLSSHAARERVFPLLLSELLKENIISSGDEAVLLKMFKEGSPVINGALDVYDLDHDMSDLVDTLQAAVSAADGTD
jgi:hypothetical protein